MAKKKIIDRKMYDTTTAEAVGSYSNTPYQSDFQHYSETLYRKRTGEFFLYGEGGAMSPYREEIRYNEWGNGDSIIPMSEDDAKHWAETHLTGEEYVEIFGPVEE